MSIPTLASDSPLVAPDRYAAAWFDLDGVLTSTAALHAAAWKRTFDPLLAEHGRASFDERGDLWELV